MYIIPPAVMLILLPVSRIDTLSVEEDAKIATESFVRVIYVFLFPDLGTVFGSRVEEAKIQQMHTNHQHGQ